MPHSFPPRRPSDLIRGVVGGIIDDPAEELGAGGRRYAGDGDHGDAGDHRTAQVKTGHGSFSGSAGDRRSAAQSRQRARSQAAAKPSRPCSASNSAMPARHVLDEAAAKASATPPTPRSNKKGRK